MTERQEYILIERYLSGELSDNELVNFEKRLMHDNEFADQVEMHRITHRAISEAGLLNVKRRLAQIHHQKQFAKKRQKRNLGLGGIIVAAIVAAILLVDFKQDEPIENTIKHVEQKPKKKNARPAIAIDTLESIPTAIDEEEPKEEKALAPQTSANTTKQFEDSEKENNIPDQTATPKGLEVNDPIEEKPLFENIPIEPEPVLEPEESSPAFDCSNVTVYFETETKSSCMDSPKGQIIVTNIEGGTEPYHVEITTQDRQVVDNPETLPKGWYKVVVSDSNECLASEEVFIHEEDCEKKYKFAPAWGEVWEIPHEHSSEGVITIYNSVGKKVYQSEINGYNDQWNGNDLNGKTLPLGGYVFEIKYTDGQITHGTVTIIN